MDARQTKLRWKLRGVASDEDVQELVKAGFDTPRKIKEAKDDDLKKVKGIGQSKLKKLREKMPKAERGEP